MKILVVLAVVLAGCTHAAKEGASASATTTCETSGTGDGFASESFAPQAAQFTAELDATPSLAPIDSVIGLADGAAAQFSQLAAIVRFNPSGTIDVRDGSIYRADVAVAYAAGTTYHFKLDVDVPAHRYTVRILQPDESYLTLATGYAFRTEQAKVAQLDHAVTEVDSTDGSLEMCELAVVASPPPGPCTMTPAGSGFAQTSIGAATGVLVVVVDATPSADQTDAVIGVADGSPASFDSLAAAVRFAPSGMIDARDGEAYRASSELAYRAGTAYQLRLVVDLSSHTYSAFVEPPSGIAVQIAQNFAFRPSQATVSQLTTVTSIVDTSDGATLQLCNVVAAAPTQLSYVRDGKQSLALLPNDELIVSDGIGTMHLDARGHVVAQVGYGGEVAVDGAGDVAVTSAGNGILTAYLFTPALDLRWVHTYPVVHDEAVISAGFDAGGDLLIATSSQGHVAAVTQLASDGSVQARTSIGPPETGATAVTLMADGFAYSYYAPTGGMAIQHQRSDGQLDWARTWPGDFTIFAMASDAAGDVAFTGQYYEDIDFAPGIVAYHPNGEVANNTYVTLLGSDTATVFATNADESYARGVATNGGEVVVSGEHDTGPRIPHLQRFDRTGRLLGDLENAGLGDFGLADRTWLAASGRVYWSRTSEYPRYQEWPYFVALPAR